MHTEDVVPSSKDKIFLDTLEGGRQSLKALERKFDVDWEEHVRVFTLEQTRAEARFQRSS